MTVGQIIEQLQKFPQHLPICVDAVFSDTPIETIVFVTKLFRDEVYKTITDKGAENTKGDFILVDF